jgi:poly-gamma-glutamate capsule biosynthesis protein CapA/YwtB (metallophosphatase superfamily)/CubicO group peptidase (beta-lactamase class C family)
MNKSKLIIITVATVLFSTVAVFLFLPSNYYIRRALTHFMPRIDQYPIFENRIVKAGAPKSWELSEYYNKLSIPDKYLKDFKKYKTVSYVIIKDGKLLFEQYWDGYSSASHSNSFSMAKSIVSLAVGCAIDDGFIKSVNQPVSHFFPQFGGYNGHVLTVKNLLTMSAGFDFEESYSSLFSPVTQLYYGDDLAKITFGMEEREAPGKKFEYQSGVTQLLAYIVEKATGEKNGDYVSRKIWTPLNAEEDALWSLDKKDGMEKAYCCFNSNARDFARLGQLILNKGQWNGNRIVSEQYITEAITADSTLTVKKDGATNHRYGFQFWFLEKDGRKIPYFRGMLGQYIFVIPEENAIVVRLGKKGAKTGSENGYYPKDIDTWLDAAFEMLDSIPKKVRLVFGGDLMVHAPQITAARQKNGNLDFSEVFEYVKPVFEKADLSFINFETTVSLSNTYSGFPMFRSPKKIAEAVKNAGIDVVVLANNHAFDGWKKGVVHTQTILDSLHLKHTGVFTDSIKLSGNHPLILTANGLNIALLNYTYGTNGLSVPEGLIINMLDTIKIKNDILNIDRKNMGAVVVFFHWGNEYQRKPSVEQRQVAEMCHRLGAEIVIGSHPHVIQPIEKTNEYVTVYSLGNLVSNQRWRYSDGGILVTLDLFKEKDKPLKINTSYTPVWVQLPKYKILPPSVADTVTMTAKQKTDYKRFIDDTEKLLGEFY